MSDSDLSPFAKSLGVEILEKGATRTVGQFKVDDRLCNRPNNAAGGLMMAVANELGGLLASANLPDGTATLTVDSNTNFLASIPHNDVARIECSVIYADQQKIVWEAKVTRSDGRLAAIVSQTELISRSN